MNRSGGGARKNGATKVDGGAPGRSQLEVNALSWRWFLKTVRIFLGILFASHYDFCITLERGRRGTSFNSNLFKPLAPSIV
jgi:hypothetical protein